MLIAHDFSLLAPYHNCTSIRRKEQVIDTKETLSTSTIALHWVVGVLMIFMLVSGLVMEDLELSWLFDTHTSVGVAIVLFVIPRLVLRYLNGWPEPAGHYTKFEKNQW